MQQVEQAAAAQLGGRGAEVSEEVLVPGHHMEVGGEGGHSGGVPRGGGHCLSGHSRGTLSAVGEGQEESPLSVGS
ncbi:hypothetical protein GCM10009578_030940 [Streptomyces rhizosphaericus]